MHLQPCHLHAPHCRVSESQEGRMHLPLCHLHAPHCRVSKSWQEGRMHLPLCRVHAPHCRVSGTWQKSQMYLPLSLLYAPHCHISGTRRASQPNPPEHRLLPAPPGTPTSSQWPQCCKRQRKARRAVVPQPFPTEPESQKSLHRDALPPPVPEAWATSSRYTPGQDGTASGCAPHPSDPAPPSP